MKLNEKIKTTITQNKRVGRGLGSGRGKTSGRGTKGQKSRSGYNIPRRFEGGQMALIQRSPKKKGFASRQQKPEIIKISVIESKFKPGSKIDIKALFEKGLIKNKTLAVKIVTDIKPTKNYIFREISLVKKIRDAKIEKIKLVKKKSLR
ncbi:MAG: LSU ribosomal protein L15p (L27Ae) [Berkelbacteria bacterium GW2011_GWB1_38_5]|uniref:Large ribosomal subunit protein uL15 n=2 Tax=Candidatus Berkelbacteria TaxID=1618330 RepID=A0A0G0LSK4_9BACT|nr:MAG: LSU ribosomal protein L15p (L27Ae) [Berkelbacteria bacterium GW2011_GWB1_38_5]KKQ90960.1 MAG: LSU ribosomal protein L15p (L27Ae) [Berkelbacteria bacterium GW2011_GWA1_39_10]